MSPECSKRRLLATARKKLTECDDGLAEYRQALEAGTDPATQTTAEMPKGE